MPERRVAFEGVANFRDLGGYESSTGRTTKWGIAYRADALGAMTRADLELFEQLQISRVFDLRSEQERLAQPDPVPSEHISLVGTSNSKAVLPEGTKIGFEDGERFLRTLYGGIFNESAAAFGHVFGRLAEDGGLPVVFHCTAGKDRTGLLAAVLLESVGVDREVVLDDYELTMKYVSRGMDSAAARYIIGLGLPPEAAAGMLGAPRWILSEALADLDSQYGNVVGYLTGPAGVSAEAIDRIRDRLLD